MDLQDADREDTMSCFYGATLQKDPSCALPCSWAAGDPSSFLVRGSTYLQDHHKVLFQFCLLVENFFVLYS